MDPLLAVERAAARGHASRIRLRGNLGDTWDAYLFTKLQSLLC